MARTSLRAILRKIPGKGSTSLRWLEIVVTVGIAPFCGWQWRRFAHNTFAVSESGTAGPSASLGMTKGRAALTSAAVTEGWTERSQVIRDFHPLDFDPTARRGRRDGEFKGRGPPLAVVEVDGHSEPIGVPTPTQTAHSRSRSIAHQEPNLDKYDSQPSLQDSNLKRQVVTPTL
jgi:hypothetical protein